MFPPATSITERTRVEAENRLIEQEAMLRAQFSSGERTLDSLRQALSALWQRATSKPQAVEPETPCPQTSPAVPC